MLKTINHSLSSFSAVINSRKSDHTKAKIQMIVKMSFKGKVVIVAGSSSGIGAATAIHFAKLGADLALVAKILPGDNMDEVINECSKYCKPLVFECDLTDENQVQNVINRTVEQFGKIDVLVNSVGILENGSIENTSLKQYDQVMNINVRTMFEMIRVAVPYLVQTKGTIVNVSSVTGMRAFPGVLAYCLSKAAVDQLTRCVALELAPKQVRVNSVNPGVIITNIHKRAGMTESDYQAFLKKCQETHALGRPGEVHEVAETITFLASDAASYITGVNLAVDGGRQVMCPR